jgi:hypothetical protein
MDLGSERDIDKKVKEGRMIGSKGTPHGLTQPKGGAILGSDYSTASEV